MTEGFGEMACCREVRELWLELKEKELIKKEPAGHEKKNVYISEDIVRVNKEDRIVEVELYKAEEYFKKRVKEAFFSCVGWDKFNLNALFVNSQFLYYDAKLSFHNGKVVNVDYGDFPFNREVRRDRVRCFVGILGGISSKNAPLLRGTVREILRNLKESLEDPEERARVIRNEIEFIKLLKNAVIMDYLNFLYRKAYYCESVDSFKLSCTELSFEGEPDLIKAILEASLTFRRWMYGRVNGHCGAFTYSKGRFKSEKLFNGGSERLKIRLQNVESVCFYEPAEVFADEEFCSYFVNPSKVRASKVLEYLLTIFLRKQHETVFGLVDINWEIFKFRFFEILKRLIREKLGVEKGELRGRHLCQYFRSISEKLYCCQLICCSGDKLESLDIFAPLRRVCEELGEERLEKLINTPEIVGALMILEMVKWISVRKSDEIADLPHLFKTCFFDPEEAENFSRNLLRKELLKGNCVKCDKLNSWFFRFFRNLRFEGEGFFQVNGEGEENREGFELAISERKLEEDREGLDKELEKGEAIDNIKQILGKVKVTEGQKDIEKLKGIEDDYIKEFLKKHCQLFVGFVRNCHCGNIRNNRSLRNFFKGLVEEFLNQADIYDLERGDYHFVVSFIENYLRDDHLKKLAEDKKGNLIKEFTWGEINRKTNEVQELLLRLLLLAPIFMKFSDIIRNKGEWTIRYRLSRDDENYIDIGNVFLGQTDNGQWIVRYDGGIPDNKKLWFYLTYKAMPWMKIKGEIFWSFANILLNFKNKGKVRNIKTRKSEMLKRFSVYPNADGNVFHLSWDGNRVILSLGEI